jgi:membrane protease YdiL (CAAX protease family)
MRLPVQWRLTPRAELVAFFLVAFGFSWSFWIAAAVFGGGDESGVANKTLLYAGIPGPFVAACLLLYIGGANAAFRDFWRRIYEVERLAPRWLAAVLLIYPMITVLAVGLDWISGGPLPDTEKLTKLLLDPILLLGSIGYLFLLGPLPEEPGWRGYALDRLLMHCGAVTASIWLGILWALWHVPLFFVTGTYQHGIGFGTLAFWLFNLTAVSGSILITWVYQYNERSIFSAILFHAVLNFTRDVLPLSDRTELIRTILLTLLACIIAIRWRSKARLARHE